VDWDRPMLEHQRLTERVVALFITSFFPPIVLGRSILACIITVHPPLLYSMDLFKSIFKYSPGRLHCLQAAKRHFTATTQHPRHISPLSAILTPQCFSPSPLHLQYPSSSNFTPFSISHLPPPNLVWTHSSSSPALMTPPTTPCLVYIGRKSFQPISPAPQ
jgi:hypothetical protein